MELLAVVGTLFVTLVLAVWNLISKSKQLGKAEAENEVIEQNEKANLARTEYKHGGEFADRVRDYFKR